MKVVCHTNLDLFNESWPTDLPTIPQVGHKIESKTYRGNKFRLSLKVVSVRWRYEINSYVPYIELHDYQKRSISDFYKWYAPLVGKSVSSFI
jgi:hypothetical protein